ncbi:MAG: hypothetical protein Tp1124DCM412261_9 [Prokaryotic dsDNA virus sp.]|nr:MAG: hypothetical protein Tp1123DCM939791_25 [Prokaryotic dsDNA virus sp.]QDP59841.1 MAG: hypothetical protein Tp1124DCM412261_9 [Prokaryotic dsDNA virus sp.]|tara:strand:- start:1686 stop:2111 length:426 start_codon:yes stop_codon:yes gene_type:complete
MYKRPIYETSEHLKREYAVRDIIQKKWICKLEKLPRKDIIDYAICRQGGICGWVEIKCRKQEYTLSTHLMISMHKINHGRFISDSTGLPFFLVVKFNRDIYYYKDNRENHELRWAGRIKSQRDDEDLEPCYFIEIGLFKKL